MENIIKVLRQPGYGISRNDAGMDTCRGLNMWSRLRILSGDAAQIQSGGVQLYLKENGYQRLKSFADHTEISLFPGINIVVGPNGCGKSNIVDAYAGCWGKLTFAIYGGRKAKM
jgi:uncharacterized membrane protein